MNQIELISYIDNNIFTFGMDMEMQENRLAGWKKKFDKFTNHHTKKFEMDNQKYKWMIYWGISLRCVGKFENLK